MLRLSQRSRFVAFAVGVAIGFILIFSKGDRLFPHKGSPQKYFEPKGSMSLSQVRRLPEDSWLQVPFSYRVMRDYDGQVWLRTSIENGAKRRAWVIGNVFGWFQSLDFYLVSDGATQRQTINFTDAVVLPNVEVILDPYQSVEVYVKANIGKFFVAELHALPAKEFRRWQQGLTSYLGLLVGILGMLAMLAMLCGCVLKDTTFFYYGIFQMLVLVLMALADGQTNTLLLNPISFAMDWERGFWAALNIVALLAVRFLQSYMKIPTNNSVFRYFYFWVLLITPMLWFFNFRFSIILSSLTLLIGLGVALFALIPHLRLTSTAIVVIGGLAPIMTSFMQTLSYEGIIPTNSLTLKFYTIGCLWEGIFFGIAIAYRFYVIQYEKNRLQQVVSGHAPKTVLNQIVSGPYGISYKFSEHEVTIMFIDIVGFSIIANQIGPKKSFERLSSFSETIYSMVKAHDGEIDRSLGDGYLSFFGYKDMDPKDHALKAFKAALAIQEFAIKSLAAAEHTNAFPMRIGIHTARVVIGNLGGDKRKDYTMIGDGVNFASRLENACNTFRINLSEATYRLLDRSHIDLIGMYEAYINIKHSADLIKCYEYSPFFGTQHRLKNAELNIFANLNKKVETVRYPAADGLIKLNSAIGSFDITDFSIDGFAGTSPLHLSPKTRISLEFVSPINTVIDDLRAKLLNKVEVEVKWSRKSDVGSNHGFQLVGLNTEQKDLLHQSLRAITEHGSVCSA